MEGGHRGGADPQPLIEARGLNAGYHKQVIVRELDLAVYPGRITALLGPNGAGKTTTILTLAGELKPIGGEILFEGKKTSAPLYRRARKGLQLVSEGRPIFTRLTVREHLRVSRVDLSRALDLFPELKPLLRRKAGLLSGGEQQMLALACALSSEPRLLLADELSLGLGPMVVQRLLAAIRRAATESGVGVLLVEQHVREAIRVADDAVVMQNGEVALRGPTSEITDRLLEVEEAYLSGSQAANGKRE
jgi:branched-chain amino acid transport system ATP-binding protein